MAIVAVVSFAEVMALGKGVQGMYLGSVGSSVVPFSQRGFRPANDLANQPYLSEVFVFHFSGDILENVPPHAVVDLQELCRHDRCVA